MTNHNRKFVKLYIITILLLSAQSFAEQNTIGTRLGVTTGHDGLQWDVYLRGFKQYAMAEASVGYGKQDYVVNGIPVDRVDQYSMSGLLGLKLPLDSVTAYVGGGASLIDNDLLGTFGSPIIQAGIEFPFKNKNLSFDYKYQVNERTNYWSCGVGFKF